MGEIQDTIREASHCVLKDVDLSELERAIGRTVSDLVGTPFVCSISGIRFTEKVLDVAAELELKLTKEQPEASFDRDRRSTGREARQ